MAVAPERRGGELPVRRRGNCVIYEWVDASGHRRYGSVYRHNFGGSWPRAEEQAKRELARERELAHNVRKGYADPVTAEVVSKRHTALDLVVAEHLADMKAAGRSRGHIACRRQVLALLTDGLLTAACVTPDRVKRFLRSRQDGCSARTFNYYRSHVLGFAKWMVRERYAATNVAEHVDMLRVLDRVRPSRALSPKEAAALLALDNERTWKYRLLLFTGLRWSESAKLRRRDFDGPHGMILIPARASKNQTEAVVPRPEFLGGELVGDRPVAPLPRLRTWRADLQAAGITYRTEAGQADRKCLRKTFATWLTKAGVSKDFCDLLMRHKSSIRQKHYLDDYRLLDELRAASARLVRWYESQLEERPAGSEPRPLARLVRVAVEMLRDGCAEDELEDRVQAAAGEWDIDPALVPQACEVAREVPT